MKMVLNVLSVPSLWTGYTLIILIIADITKGNILDVIKADVDKIITKVNIIEGNVNADIMEKIVTNIQTIEDYVNGTSIRVGIIEETVNAIHETVKSTNEIVDRCPRSGGYFNAPGTGVNQCLKVITGKMTWEEAVIKCKNEGALTGFTAELARPYNAIALRQYLFEEYDIGNFWVNARGDGSQIMWKTDQPGQSKTVGGTNPLWIEGQPGFNEGHAYCMVLAASPDLIREHRHEAYFVQHCVDYERVVCELF